MRWHDSFVLFAFVAKLSVSAERQSVAEAALDARNIMRQEEEGTLLSVYQPGVPDDSSLIGTPIGIMEYFADCSDNGSPTLLMLDIAPAMKNYNAGSKLTLSLRDRSFSNPLQHGRMYMVGTLQRIEARRDIKNVEKCFLRKHPDSEIVAPGRDVHTSAWYELKPTSIYYFGGFGNVSYIGFIPVELYQHAHRKELLRKASL